MKKTLLPVSLLGLLVLGAAILIQRGKNDISQLRTQYETEIERLEAANQSQAEQDLAEHRKLMADAALISGKRAREVHEQEWTRRCEYDPAFARTTREKTILEIAALSKDRSLPAQELLQRVATLAAPKKSTIEVTLVKGGFRIVVTFDMSVMTSGEEGSRTKHLSIESLKREVIEIISRVSRDMYDHCGQKGIDTIAIACTHGVRASQSGLSSGTDPFKGRFTLPGTYNFNRQSGVRIRKESQFPPSLLHPSSGGSTVTKTIYKCAITGSGAKKVPDWRRVPLHKVADMFRVEHNEFPYLRIVTTTTPGFGW